MAAGGIYSFYERELERIKETGSFRFLKSINEKDGKHVVYRGKRFINLSSNDYLGLAADKELIKKFYSLMKDENIISSFGPGSTSSRLLTGDSHHYRELEKKISVLYSGLIDSEKGSRSREGREALVFNSGYHANAGIFSALAGEGDLILSDSLNHASIIDGIRLSRAARETYPHMDYGRLEEILAAKRESHEKVIIATESLFSMDGDIADLKKLIEIKNRYNALLYVDEAHAFGVFGKNGLGISEVQGTAGGADVIVATFGKAMGSHGGVAIINQVLKDYLVNKARPFIFSTALPPVAIFWNIFVLDKMKSMEAKRLHLLELAGKFRETVINCGLKTFGASHIVPLIIGDNAGTLNISAELEKNGFLLFPIRPPTVPKDTSRIRVSLRADIQWEDINQIPYIIKNL